jgi:dTDP-glucose 4,6-dehydratase
MERDEVICMDNLSTGTSDNLAHLAGHPRFSFIHHDVTNYIFVEGGLDCVLHFASPASPLDYLRLPIQTLKVGALGTHKVLGLAKNKKARFLLASTSEVYGDPLAHPQSGAYWGNVNPIACSFFPENEPVNLGNPDELTIMEFGRRVLEMIGGHS